MSAARPTTGTCPQCKRIIALDDGRHLAAHNYYPDSANVRFECRGAGKLCAEASALNAEANRRRTLARVDQLREDAQVAHDAVIEKHPFPAFQLQRLLAAALQDYRVRFPEAKERRAWFVYPPFRRYARRRHRSERVDVYCTFCRELLVGGWSRGSDPKHRTEAHTTICALRVLAKIAEPVPPGERRLPSEARPDPEDF